MHQSNPTTQGYAKESRGHTEKGRRRDSTSKALMMEGAMRQGVETTR